MEKQEFLKLNQPERIKFIDQQFKSGKEVGDLFDLSGLYSHTIYVDLRTTEYGTMTSKVNAEVMKQWGDFTSARKEKAEDLFSMALREFILNHQ